MPPGPARDLSTLVKAYDVRGVVPEELDEGVAAALGAAFADLVAGEGAGSVCVGHDMRASSPALATAFGDGVRSRGLDVLDIGLCSTDGLYHASGSTRRPGAMVTASHNPARYNGIKLCRALALPVGQDSGLQEVRDGAQGYLAAGGPAAGSPAAGGPAPGTRERRSTLSEYAAHLRSLVDLRDGRRLRVVVDAGNGMAGLTAPAVLGTGAGLEPLPLDLVGLYLDLDGTFPNHEANPLEPANLLDLQAAVRAEGADVGLAFDGDADRCFVVDERGEPVSPSAVTALVALRHVAAERDVGRDALVIHNVVTSRAVPALVSAAGGSCLRTRVGHSFIKAEMARSGAVFGGEHSAHYYFRAFWGADTGMLAAMHVLAALAGQAGPLSALVAGCDPFSASGEVNSAVADPVAVRDRVAAEWVRRGAALDALDGATLSSPARDDGSGSDEDWWWFNLRASNTEPLLRLNVEAARAGTMERVRAEVLAQVRGDGAVVADTVATRGAGTSTRTRTDDSGHAEEGTPMGDMTDDTTTDGSPTQAGGDDGTGMEPWLREILRCPACHGELTDGTGPDGTPELVCPAHEPALAYRVDDGVPVLLVDEARRVG